MKRMLFWGVLVLLSAPSAQAQTGTVGGRMIDRDTQQPLIGANVLVVGTTLGAATDLEGAYTVAGVPPGTYAVRFSYLGYGTRTETDVVVRPGRITQLNAELEVAALETDEVVVTAGYFRTDDLQPVSVARFSREEVRRAPGSAGDVSRILLALPSVAKVNDTVNSLVVRGGSSFENSFYVDNIEIPNINHFPQQGASGGPIGMVNVEFIEDVRFHAGGFSAAYGDRLSSVMALRLREGNRSEFDGQVDLSMAGAGGTVEGPLGAKGSWMLSARRSYLDLIVGAIGDVDAVPEYGDLQGKIALDLSPSHRLAIVGIYGLDRIGMDPGKSVENGSNVYADARIDQGTLGANWTWLWGTSGYSNTSVSVSNLDYDQSTWDAREYHMTGEERVLLDQVGYERSWKLRNVNNAVLDGRWRAEFGFEARIDDVDYDHVYGRYDDVLGQPLEPMTVRERITAARLDGFATVSWKATERLSLSPGVRVGYAEVTGRTLVDPRFSARYELSDRTALNGSVGLFHQNLPLFLVSQAASNRDLATPRARHVVLGVEHLLSSDTRLTIEAYDKRYDDMPADPTQPQLYLFDEMNLFGTLIHHAPLVDDAAARARGVEILVQKRLADRLYGHAGVGFTRAEYRGLDGTWRSRSVENRFLAHLEGGYRLNDRWEFSARWIIASGVPYTPFDPDRSTSTRRAVYDVGRINAERMPAYQSLNVRFDRRSYFGWGNMVWYLSVWNVYAHDNVASYIWNEIDNRPDSMSGWGLIPVGGIEIEF